MARFLWWLVALPLGVVIVALGVANRRPVAFALDPFASDPFSAAAAVPPVVLPGFLVVLGTLLIGVLVGGTAVWFAEGKHRRAERRWRETARRLEDEIARTTPAPASVARIAPPARRDAA